MSDPAEPGPTFSRSRSNLSSSGVVLVVDEFVAAVGTDDALLVVGSNGFVDDIDSFMV